MKKFDLDIELKKVKGEMAALPSGKYIQRIGNRRRVFTVNNEPTMTDQSQLEDTDVNIVIGRYMKGGPDPFRNFHGYMADVSESGDLHESFRQVELAQAAFDSLPANLREKFNTPVALVNWLGNPANRDEAIELGLINVPSVALGDNPGETKRQRGSSPSPTSHPKQSKSKQQNDDEPNDDE